MWERPWGCGSSLQGRFERQLRAVFGLSPEGARQVRRAAKTRCHAILQPLPEFAAAEQFKMDLVNCAMLSAFVLSIPCARLVVQCGLYDSTRWPPAGRTAAAGITKGELVLQCRAGFGAVEMRHIHLLEPFVPTTRWHGMKIEMGLCPTAPPTACAAARLPVCSVQRAAIWP